MAIKEVLRKRLAKYLYGSAYTRAIFTLYGMVFREIQVSFTQFFTFNFPITSFFRVMGIIFSSLMRLCFGRSLKYSFSFTGEDLILHSLYKPLITYNGFYVEVGCNHPKFFSNTYSFYRKGWRGICIDANPKMVEKFAFYRPKDTAVLALVSDLTQERNFYLVENDVLSTTEEMNLDLVKKEGLSYTVIQHIPKTLTAILLENNAPKEIDFLLIDAEEHDFNVLKSLDFSQFSPKFIVLEADFDIKSTGSNLIYSFMSNNGYELIGFILKNVYFKRRSHTLVEPAIT